MINDVLHKQRQPRFICLEVKENILKQIEEVCKLNNVIPIVVFGRGSSFHGGWTDDSDIDLMITFKSSMSAYMFEQMKASSLNFSTSIINENKVHNFEVKFMDARDLVKQIHTKYDYNSVDLFMSTPFHIYDKYPLNVPFYNQLRNDVDLLMENDIYRNTFITQSIALIKNAIKSKLYKTAYLNLLRLIAIKIKDEYSTLYTWNIRGLYSELESHADIIADKSDIILSSTMLSHLLDIGNPKYQNEGIPLAEMCKRLFDNEEVINLIEKLSLDEFVKSNSELNIEFSGITLKHIPAKIALDDILSICYKDEYIHYFI